MMVFYLCSGKGLRREEKISRICLGSFPAFAVKRKARRGRRSFGKGRFGRKNLRISSGYAPGDREPVSERGPAGRLSDGIRVRGNAGRAGYYGRTL